MPKKLRVSKRESTWRLLSFTIFCFVLAFHWYVAMTSRTDGLFLVGVEGERLTMELRVVVGLRKISLHIISGLGERVARNILFV